MEENLYKAMYPTGCAPPKFYGLPQIYKQAPPSGLSYQAGVSHLWGGKSPC